MDSSCVTISKRVKTFRESSAATSVEVIRKKRSVQTVRHCEKLQASVEAALQTSLYQHSSSLHFSLNTAHQMSTMILVITPTNLFKSWKKPILSDGKIFANSFCVCYYQKTKTFLLTWGGILGIEWVGKQTKCVLLVSW